MANEWEKFINIYMLNIIGKRKIWYTFSAVLFAVSIAAVAIWGLNFGIDFTGGTLYEVKWADKVPTNQQIIEAINRVEHLEVLVQSAGNNGTIMRLPNISEETHQKIAKELTKIGTFEELSFEAVGPTVGQELKQRSLTALVIVLLAIIAYISFAFRKVSKPVPSWRYGVVAVVALFHDVIIPMGVFAVLGHFLDVKIDILFVTAALTVLGFSVHDTIVVFDRIRENLTRRPEKTFEGTVNKSVNETLARSINTSLTVLLVLFAVFFFGGATIKYFVLMLILGIVSGTYSSIFIASPLLVSWYQRSLTK